MLSFNWASHIVLFFVVVVLSLKERVMLTSQPSKNSNSCLPPFATQENLKGAKSMGT